MSDVEWDTAQEDYMKTAREKLLLKAQGLVDTNNNILPAKKVALKKLMETRITSNNDAVVAQARLDIKKIIDPHTHADLYYLLADFSDIVDTRKSFNALLGQETYAKTGSLAYKEITDARTEVQKSLNFPFDSAKEWKGTGLVFGYTNGREGKTGHYEKFVNSPLIIQKNEDNTKELKDPGTKEYFLKNLQQFQSQENILQITVDKINDHIKTKLGIPGTFTVDELITYLIAHSDKTDTTKISFGEGNKQIEIGMSTEFRFGFFADCANESLLMGEIKIDST
ncbi:MAG: hypothetical protein LBD75_02335 [Candidatus Peribacteria bacterium]|jgi:hypothetical protein|nr:hypothetical protein [Candidatus Peribacteria bacterium]